MYASCTYEIQLKCQPPQKPQKSAEPSRLYLEKNLFSAIRESNESPQVNVNKNIVWESKSALNWMREQNKWPNAVSQRPEEEYENEIEGSAARSSKTSQSYRTHTSVGRVIAKTAFREFLMTSRG